MLKFLFGIILIGYGFFRTLFSDPVWGLYLFITITHVRLVQLSENIPLPLNVPIVIAVVTLLMYLISPNYPKKFNLWPLETFLFGVIVVGMAMSSFNAYYDPAISWERTYTYFKYWVFFVMFIHLVNSFEKIKLFHWTMILSAAWLVYRAWDLRGTTGARFENVGGDVISDTNHYAAALVLLFPFVFQKAFSKNKSMVFFALVLCFGICMAIIISGSRGGILGLASLILLSAINFKAQRKRIGVLLIILLIAIIPFINEYHDNRFQSLVNATDEETRDMSSKLRVDAWNLSLQLFRDNMFTGVGIGNFPYYSGVIEGKRQGELGHVAHSIWFEALAEGGLLVLVPFLYMIIRFYRITGIAIKKLKLRDNMSEQVVYIQTIRIALGAFLVCATFLNRMIYEPIYWCFALGVVHINLINKSGQEIDCTTE